MRATRKLLLVGAIVLAAMMSAASMASAVTVRQEPGNTACPAGPTVAAHIVTGGCHATFTSNGGIPLLAHTGAAEVAVSNCTVSFEARVNSAGSGFITNQVFGGGAACTRAPCDEVTGFMRKHPWPLTLTSFGGGVFTLEVTFCLRTVAGGEFRAGSLCTVHFVIIASGHTYTAHPSAGVGQEAACEGLPQVEISGSFNSTATERFELS